MERWNCIYCREYAERSDEVYRALSTAGTNDPALLSNADKWTLIADSVAEARKHVYVDTDYWDQFDIGSNLSTSLLGENAETVQSSQALGTINMQVSLASANFGTFNFKPRGLGNFFIGEGEGAVRIDYNVNSIRSPH